MYDISISQNFDFSSQEAQGFFAKAHFKPYQSPLWLRVIQETLVEKQNSVFVIIKKDTQLIALFPFLRVKEKGLTFIKMLDCGVSDENDCLILPEYLEGLKQDKTLFTRFIKALKPFDMLILDKVIASHAVILQLFPALKTHNYRFSSHKLALDKPFEALREEKYNGTHRRTLDKKGGKLSRKGNLRLQEMKEAGEIKETFQEFLKFRAFRFAGQETDITQEKAFQDFYLSYCLAGIPKGVARMMRLRLDNVTLGVTIGLTFEKAYQIVMLGFEREAYANWSPGLVLVDKIIEDGLKRGETFVDLTIGDEPYKYLFGVESEPVSLLYYAQSLKGKAYALARYKGAIVKRWFVQKREAWSKKAGSSSQKEKQKQEEASV